MELDDFSEFDAELEELEAFEAAHGAEAIKKESRYSRAINDYISSIEELRFYQDKLDLEEAKITRPCLIRDTLDARMPNRDGIPNYEQMAKGRPPVFSYGGDDTLELHHLKREYRGPFAELTPTQHNRPGKGIILHPKGKDEESWRSDHAKCHAFDMERAKYWMKRGETVYGQLFEPAARRSFRRKRRRPL